MLVDTNAPILGLDGRPLEVAGDVVTLRTIIQGALLATLPEDSKMPGARKAELFRLALAANADSVDWKAEDVALIKDRIGQVSTPLAVGRAYELIDPPASGLLGDNLHS